ncbi:hypothetical protein ACQP2F_44775 [Actinoplanes sp. CA-030573]|uniref:hypothetical protein n=1 Tax=Actinoplanes sp. CA-030573 TaxID=3239898 RepID=UPI003D9142BC
MPPNPLFQRLRRLRLPAEHCAVFGSGPLVAHGIKASAGDLDVLARGPAWERALALGTPVVPASGYGEMVELEGGRIQIFNAWTSPSWDTDSLIDGADVIDGIRFVTLAEVLRWKEAAGRAKDVPDIELLRRALS